MNGVADAIGALVFTLLALCLVFIPLGAWKMCELIYELSRHIHWN